MRYVPDGPALDGQPHLRIGPTPPDRRAPTVLLGNEPGIALPDTLRGDTATATALRVLRAPGELLDPGALELVTCAEYSGDHLLATWALCCPDQALARADLIEDVARAVEFGVCRGELVTQIACFLRAYPDEAGVHEPQALFEELLPSVPDLLEHPRDFDLYWIGEYSDVLRANALLHSGAVQLEDIPELDLTVLETPLRLHDFTRLTAAPMFRLLTVRSENTYMLEYRRESWVHYRSRRPLPRISLAPLAQRLNLFERAPGRWRADPVTDPIPRLLLDGGDGLAAPSRIDAATVKAEVLDFLRDAARRPELHWTPRHGLPHPL